MDAENVQAALEELNAEATNIEDSSLRATAEALANLEGRIKGLETFLSNAVFDTLQVDYLNVVENLNMFKLSNLIKIGTPRMIGFDFATGGTFTLTVDGEQPHLLSIQTLQLLLVLLHR